MLSKVKFTHFITVSQVSIFSRVKPAQKTRLVELLKGQARFLAYKVSSDSLDQFGSW